MGGVDRSNVARGRWGEQRAVTHYERLGFSVVARNWRPHGYGVRGDLDLIVGIDDLVVDDAVPAMRNHVTRLLRARDPDVALADEILIVERGVRHGRAGQADRGDDGLRRQHARASHLHRNVLNDRLLFFRRTDAFSGLRVPHRDPYAVHMMFVRLLATRLASAQSHRPTRTVPAPGPLCA